MKARLLLYFFVLTLPALLFVTARQAIRYNNLKTEVVRLEAEQETWLEGNKRLIAGIAVLSSSARIERIAQNDLRLSKKMPEEILQIRVGKGRRNDG
ncbi:MAG: cell division protein FtsL [Treponema sp.]|jgi:cell division protein FtsL|nr:cell division protein FtsL [Treponema sp.]